MTSAPVAQDLAALVRRRRPDILGGLPPAAPLEALLDQVIDGLAASEPSAPPAADALARARLAAGVPLGDVLREIAALRDAILRACPRAKGAEGVVRLFDEAMAAAAEGYVRAAEERRAVLGRRVHEMAHERQRMLSFVSHELKNPLNSISLAAAVLEQQSGRVDPATADRCAATIRRSTTRMNELIENLVDLGALQGGRLSVVRASLDPAAPAEDAVQAWQAAAREKGLTLEVRTGPLPGAIMSDRRRLAHALWHLVGNAVKATAKGRVDVYVFGEGHEVVYAIEDTGPGIRPEHQALVLEPYGRVPDSPYAGAGLGVPIARGTAETLGGSLSFDSEPGRGSIFRIRVPASAPES